MTTTDSVRDALENLSSVEFHVSHDKDHIRAFVDESEAGLLFKAIRVNGFDAESKRLGDTIVSQIEVQQSLGDLFA